MTSKIPVSTKKIAPKKPSSPEPVTAVQPPQSSIHSSKNLAPQKPTSAEPVAASQPPPPPPLTRQNPISSDTDSFLSTKEEIEGEEEEQPRPDKSLFESTTTTTASRKNSNESDDSVITKKPDRSIFAVPIVGGVLGGKRRPVKKQDSSEIDSDSSFKIRRFEAKKGDDESITLGHEEISDVDSTDNEDTDKK